MYSALITGVFGFTAKHLIQRLQEEGDFFIVGLDLSEKKHKDIYIDRYICADITDQAMVDRAIHEIKPDYVFNLAGLSTGPADIIYQVNVLGTICLLESIYKYSQHSRVLLIGSSAEYGYLDFNQLPVKEDHACVPMGPNGISKHTTTLIGLDYARRLGMKVVIARPFNLIGAGIPKTLVVGAVLSRLSKQLQDGTEESVVKVGNLSTVRDFVSVSDAVDAYLKMLQGDYWGEVFNICSGIPVSIEEILNRLLEYSIHKVRLEVDPAIVRPSDIPIIFGSWEKANRYFNFKPSTSLDEALRESWEAMQKETMQCD